MTQTLETKTTVDRIKIHKTSPELYDAMMALQLVRGLSVGAFIPAALGFVLRSLAPQWWIWGIAAYAFRFVFSQNIAGALEGWYSESGRWEWIFWQNAVLTPVMVALAAGAPRLLLDNMDEQQLRAAR